MELGFILVKNLKEKRTLLLIGIHTSTKGGKKIYDGCR